MSSPEAIQASAPLPKMQMTADAPTTPAPEHDDPPEGDISEHDFTPSLEESAAASTSPADQAPRGEPYLTTNFCDRGTSPAFVPPIPKVPNIANIPSSNRPHIPQHLLQGLVGKTIDAYGYVVEDVEGSDEKRILARVEGDLPSMVGRPVTNANGDVLGDDGDLIGYVSGIGSEEEDRGETEQTTESLEHYTHGDSKTFRVDDEGNILNGRGTVVGKLHDKRGKRKEEEDKNETGSPPKRNAESYRKGNEESPSDLFLDVKSTHEGIQLVIRIPTVFGGKGPNITIS